MTDGIVLATAAHAPGVHGIYAPVVRTSATSFEWEPPSVDEMAARIAGVTADLPWLVLERDGAVAGYAYASHFRARAAYRWSVETSVYVHADQRGRGVGRALYGALLPMLGALGYGSVYAGITLPNPASVALHERLGFAPLGAYARAGYKLGAWHDVGWWQLHLPVPDPPPEPRPVQALAGTEAWAHAVAAGLATLA
jgi:L-amino acid N-acyltransferase YncA